MTELIMPTIEERELLMKNVDPKYTGFTPRPVEKLTRRKKPRTMLNIECSHFLRTDTDGFVHGNPTLEYKLWKEAGKHEPPYPNVPDQNYNSNIWRNFRRQYGFSTRAEGRKISDVIASMYPLNIPRPSQIGEHTFEKYVRETKLFNNEKYKILAMERTKTDIQEFKRLRSKSDARNPPLDEDGNILPPEHFKKYDHRFIPPPPAPPTPPPTNQKTDSLGQRYVPKSEPHLWKLSYKINHPQYDGLKKEIKKRQEFMKNRSSPAGVLAPKNIPSPDHTEL